MKYVALLRGVNVGGNSMLKMSELRASFERLGFMNVITYINSGNVIFESSATHARYLEPKIESLLLDEFVIANKVVVRSQKDYIEILNKIPNHWQDNTMLRCNVIFLRHEIDSNSILDGLNPKTDIDEVAYTSGVLFWAANASDLTKSTMIKLAKSEIYKNMTVRNLNTTLKIGEILTSL